MGAVSFTRDFDTARRISRRMFIQTGTLTMSSSYSTGGDTGFDPIPGGNYVNVDIEPAGGRVFEFDKTNKRVIARRYDYPAAAAGVAIEEASGANLSAVTTRYSAMAKA